MRPRRSALRAARSDALVGVDRCAVALVWFGAGSKCSAVWQNIASNRKYLNHYCQQSEVFEPLLQAIGSI